MGAKENARANLSSKPTMRRIMMHMHRVKQSQKGIHIREKAHQGVSSSSSLTIAGVTGRAFLETGNNGIPFLSSGA